MLSGTLLNVLTVSVGSTLGLIVGQKMPDRIHKIIFDGLGLLTLLVGVQMGLETKNVLFLLGAILIGGIIGELLKIESNLDRFGNWAQLKLARGNDGRFSEAFVASSLVFCVGPMTITGSLQNGLTGDYRLLALKSFLDLFSSFAFAASLGWGVFLSVLTILVFQGGLSLGAGLFSGILNDTQIISELTAAGGILIIGIGIRLLDVKRIPVANFLPALVVSPLLVMAIRNLEPVFRNLFSGFMS